MNVKALCEDCGNGMELAIGIPVKLICQACSSAKILLPKDCIVEEIGKATERIFVLKIKSEEELPVESDPIKPDDSPVDPKKTPVIGDEGNEPPLERKMQPLKKKKSRKSSGKKRKLIKR